MKKLFYVYMIFFILISLSISEINAKEKQSIINRVIKPFAAPTALGTLFSLQDKDEYAAIAVVFTCNHCPFANLYTDRLNAFYQEYLPKGVLLIAINPMDSILYEDETLSNMQTKALKDNFLFPYLQDADQSIAKAFSADFTPQVYLLQKRHSSWNIVYKGIIDDNGKSPEIARNYLKEAADSLLLQRPIKDSIVESFGCKIIYRH
jgi:hypothetical protein